MSLRLTGLQLQVVAFLGSIHWLFKDCWSLQPKKYLSVGVSFAVTPARSKEETCTGPRALKCCYWPKIWCWNGWKKAEMICHSSTVLLLRFLLHLQGPPWLSQVTGPVKSDGLYVPIEHPVPGFKLSRKQKIPASPEKEQAGDRSPVGAHKDARFPKLDTESEDISKRS